MNLPVPRYPKVKSPGLGSALRWCCIAWIAGGRLELEISLCTGIHPFEKNPESGLPSSTTSIRAVPHRFRDGGVFSFWEKFLELTCQPRVLNSPTALSHDNPFSLHLLCGELVFRISHKLCE